LVRIEEISPFPFQELIDTLSMYRNARECYFVQEEPRNQGVWPHVKDRLDFALEQVGWSAGRVEFRGRKESAVPAPGIGNMYGVQQKIVVESALEGL
jgi:probable 2-oxoglutarate dehydrogenase E1 component DHKTD1